MNIIKEVLDRNDITIEQAAELSKTDIDILRKWVNTPINELPTVILYGLLAIFDPDSLDPNLFKGEYLSIIEYTEEEPCEGCGKIVVQNHMLFSDGSRGPLLAEVGTIWDIPSTIVMCKECANKMFEKINDDLSRKNI